MRVLLNCYLWNGIQKLIADGCQLKAAWTASSVGSEHYLDRVGVAGSSPAQFTSNVSDVLYVSLAFSYQEEGSAALIC